MASPLPPVLVAIIAEYAAWRPVFAALWFGTGDATKPLEVDEDELAEFYEARARGGDVSCLRALWAQAWTARLDHDGALAAAILTKQVGAIAALRERGATEDGALLYAVWKQRPTTVQTILARSFVNDCGPALQCLKGETSAAARMIRAALEDYALVNRSEEGKVSNGVKLLEAAKCGDVHGLRSLHVRWRHVTDALVAAVAERDEKAAQRLRDELDRGKDNSLANFTLRQFLLKAVEAKQISADAALKLAGSTAHIRPFLEAMIEHDDALNQGLKIAAGSGYESLAYRCVTRGADLGGAATLAHTAGHKVLAAVLHNLKAGSDSRTFWHAVTSAMQEAGRIEEWSHIREDISSAFGVTWPGSPYERVWDPPT